MHALQEKLDSALKRIFPQNSTTDVRTYVAGRKLGCPLSQVDDTFRAVGIAVCLWLRHNR